MAVAAPARRSQSQAAPAAPARTAPPEPKKRPRDRPRPGGPGRSAATAPATAPKRKAPAPKRKPAAPKRKAQTAAPARKTAPKRRAPGRVIPIAAGTVGRTAVAVTQLPESGLIHRLTRGRVWIGLLGLLLIGIVGLNVVTLSFAASAGKIEERNLALSKDNSVAQTRWAEKNGQEQLHNAAKQLGLAPNMKVEPTPLTVTQGAVGTAASRLAAAAAATAGTTEGEGETAVEGEATSGETASSGGAAIAGEGTMTAEEAAEVNLEGLSQEELNAIYEETLAREAAEAAAVTETPTG